MQCEWMAMELLSRPEMRLTADRTLSCPVLSCPVLFYTRTRTQSCPEPCPIPCPIPCPVSGPVLFRVSASIGLDWIGLEWCGGYGKEVECSAVQCRVVQG
jgi:hypothetical protein